MSTGSSHTKNTDTANPRIRPRKGKADAMRPMEELRPPPPYQTKTRGTATRDTTRWNAYDTRYMRYCIVKKKKSVRVRTVQGSVGWGGTHLLYCMRPTGGHSKISRVASICVVEVHFPSRLAKTGPLSTVSKMPGVYLEHPPARSPHSFRRQDPPEERVPASQTVNQQVRVAAPPPFSRALPTEDLISLAKVEIWRYPRCRG